jgi:hypothetical protein
MAPKPIVRNTILDVLTSAERPLSFFLYNSPPFLALSGGQLENCNHLSEFTRLTWTAAQGKASFMSRDLQGQKDALVYSYHITYQRLLSLRLALIASFVSVYSLIIR